MLLKNELCNAITRVNNDIFRTVVLQNHSDFPPEIVVNNATVDIDLIFHSKSAPWSESAICALGRGYRQSSVKDTLLSRRDSTSMDRADVIASSVLGLPLWEISPGIEHFYFKWFLGTAICYCRNYATRVFILVGIPIIPVTVLIKRPLRQLKYIIWVIIGVATITGATDTTVTVIILGGSVIERVCRAGFILP